MVVTMNCTKKIVSGIMALAMVAGLSSCGNKEGAEQTTTTSTTAATTTTAGVEINTAQLDEEDKAKVNSVADQLPDVELENKEIKWLAHYDKNPDTTGSSKSVSLELFETKYGGKIKWYPTTWDNRYNDLSTYVLGGEGIDFFPGDDTANLPKGVVSGMFQPIDDYVDFDSPLWQNTKSAMEIYNFNGKHYEMVTNVTAEQVVIYSRKTIEENGLDDPYELWKEGKWNWDTFEGMLVDYCDEDAECYGLDGFWAEKALFLSAGVPCVSTKDGELVCNINDPTVEKAMNYQYELFQKGLVINREQFSWNQQPQFMGEGKELFYICGIWALRMDPSIWNVKIDPKDVMVVPVPSPEGSDPYQSASLGGYVLCKGAQNPEGVALFAQCDIVASLDESAVAISDQKCKDDYGWTDELIQANKEIDELARKYPVVELATGCSSDIASITTDGGDKVGTRAALHGVEWASNRAALADTLIMLVEEVNNALKTAK
jgi:ABC-type glycerol-3-phosphate transport system substrate-binding protein